MNNEKFDIKRIIKYLIVALILVLIVIFFSIFLIEWYSGSGNSSPVRKWSDTTEINIFDGDVYPGAEGEANFSIKNTANGDLPYIVYFYNQNGTLPLKYRLKCNGEYIIGDKTTWEETTQREKAKISESNIERGDRIDITIEWMWEFESGEDERDTELGDLEAKEKFFLTLESIGETDSTPVITRTDTVELILWHLYPILTLFLFAAIRLLIGKYIRERKTESD